MRFLLAAMLACSAFAAEFKLPENFLVFDASKLHSAVATTRPMQSSSVIKKPTPVACGHIRILEVPNHVDPKMIQPFPASTDSRMPVFQGPPTCQAPNR